MNRRLDATLTAYRTAKSIAGFRLLHVVSGKLPIEVRSLCLRIFHRDHGGSPITSKF